VCVCVCACACACVCVCVRVCVRVRVRVRVRVGVGVRVRVRVRTCMYVHCTPESNAVPKEEYKCNTCRPIVRPNDCERGVNYLWHIFFALCSTYHCRSGSFSYHSLCQFDAATLVEWQQPELCC